MPPLLLVTYEDMSFSSSSFTAEDAKTFSPCIMTEIGFLVREDDESLVIAGEWREGLDFDEWRYLTAMPKVGIKSRTVLRPVGIRSRVANRKQGT